MKLLICTPAYGGMVTSQYLKSLIPVLANLPSIGVEADLHMEESESLISRGRNTCAMYALKNGYDKLLFIDADMIFTFENIKKLIESKEMIVGGTYPLKAFPITINFNPLVEQRDLFGDHRQIDNYFEWVKKYADENGEAEVAHLPTGFLLIDCKVFAKLSYVVPWYQTFSPEFKIKNQFFDFFPVRVTNNEYESEDWAFCSIARENGFKVVLQTQAVNKHTGTLHYSIGQHVVTGQDPIIPVKKKSE